MGRKERCATTLACAALRCARVSVWIPSLILVASVLSFVSLFFAVCLFVVRRDMFCTKPVVLEALVDGLKAAHAAANRAARLVA